MEKGIEQDELNIVSMNVILHAGNARETIIAALDELSNQNVDFDKIEAYLKTSKQELNTAHKMQTDMIQLEANDKAVPFSVLFIHSQDTLMTIQSELLVTEKMVNIFRKRI